MKRFAYLAICIIAMVPVATFAQDQSDALRYSQLSVGGTARFMAMGGAFTALGGDMSTLTYNPAGIGVYRKTQFTFTPGFNLQNTTSTYNGTPSTGEQSRINIQNLGWISTWKNRRDEGMWKDISFGIVYNRTNDFNYNINIAGNNSKNSITDQFANNANGLADSNLDPFTSQQAFNADLIGKSNGNNGTSYFSVVDPFLANGNNTVYQQMNIARSGSMGETDISFGGNYKDKLFLGASIGIPVVRYSENDYYSETPSYTDTLYGFQGMNYNTTLNTSGGGVNFKIGAIYRFTDWLRIGAAVHTPTWFSLTDNYSSFITATYTNTKYYTYPDGPGTYAGTVDGNPVTGSYNYTLTTPMRAMGGLAFVIHHQGIISADYEWVDYSTAQLHSTPPDQFGAVNQAIQRYYMQASNIRIGAEWVFYPFSIRAGYTYYGNPYSSSAGNSSIRNSYSAGLGIKINRCFIDLAYVLMQYSENYYLYDPSLVNAAKNATNVSYAAVTFGVNL